MTLEVGIKTKAPPKVACLERIAILDSCLTQMSNYIKKQFTDSN